jgi:hypothetical protein
MRVILGKFGLKLGRFALFWGEKWPVFAGLMHISALFATNTVAGKGGGG